MMSRKLWGPLVPIVVTVVAGLVIQPLSLRSDIKGGILTGLGIALVQSLVSVGALQWAWKRTSFYWVWGGGMLLRLLIFALTAFVVHQFTALNLAAVLLALAGATMIFMVTETSILFWKNKKKE